MRGWARESPHSPPRPQPSPGSPASAGHPCGQEGEGPCPVGVALLLVMHPECGGTGLVGARAGDPGGQLSCLLFWVLRNIWRKGIKVNLAFWLIWISASFISGLSFPALCLSLGRTKEVGGGVKERPGVGGRLGGGMEREGSGPWLGPPCCQQAPHLATASSSAL